MRNIRIIKTGINVSKILKQIEEKPEYWNYQQTLPDSTVLDPHVYISEAAVMQLVIGYITHPDDYVFVRFQKSTSKGKKYDAILKNKLTGRTKKVSFGAKGMEQYKDSTGLGKYTNANHNDPVRRALYRKSLRRRSAANAARYRRLPPHAVFQLSRAD